MRGNRGFSLLEVMISAVLLVTALAAVLQAFGSASTVAARNRHLTQAIHVCESVAEALLMREQSDDDLKDIPHVDVLHFDTVGEQVAAPGTYRVSWVVEPNTPIQNVRRITITTRWVEAGGGTTTMTVHRR
jgi:prepilin-type N-terminal cleavage/methylation domain-containing protein